MDTFEKAKEVLTELFAKDCQFALATVKDNVPSLRYVDTFYDDGAFYVVTYGKSNKVEQLSENPSVALCDIRLVRFSGRAYNIGHPLEPKNAELREKLIKVFEPWYFAHNNENDENMCYVKIELETGFFYMDKTGYWVDFKERTASEFPFENPIGEI